MEQDPVVKRVKRDPVSLQAIRALELTNKIAREAHRAAKAAHLAVIQVLTDAGDVAIASVGSRKGEHWHPVYHAWLDTPAGKAAKDAAIPALHAHFAAQEAYWVTRADFKAARQCRTLSDLLTCDRSAVRIAAQFALADAPEPTPPAQKRKR